MKKLFAQPRQISLIEQVLTARRTCTAVAQRRHLIGYRARAVPEFVVRTQHSTIGRLRHVLQEDFEPVVRSSGRGMCEGTLSSTTRYSHQEIWRERMTR